MADDYPTKLRGGCGIGSKTLPRKSKKITAIGDFFVVFPSVVVHELGHYLAARVLGSKVLKFRTYPSLGGFVEHETLPRAWMEIVVSLAGPALELAVGAALMLKPTVAWSLTRIADFTLGDIILSYLGLAWMIWAIPHGSWDFKSAAMNAGWTRLAFELGFRMAQDKYRRSWLYFPGYYRILFDLFIREPLEPLFRRRFT